MVTFRFHQYQVVGRALPTEKDEHPKIYRMKLWATNEVRAKSKFWYFLRKLKKVKKSNGQVLAINEVGMAAVWDFFDMLNLCRHYLDKRFRCYPFNCCPIRATSLGSKYVGFRHEYLRVATSVISKEIFEKNPTKIKNHGIWLRYQSRTGYHNMYKEYRDTTLNGSVEQMYTELASRHRVRFPCIQIIKTATIPAKLCKRESTKQFHKKDIKFPQVFQKVRPPTRNLKTTYKATKPNLFK
ncbi:hypothetical protein GIB67_036977 [Kingdonia uniflora]|uniref:Large ribosomal subunit protein eL20 domain-containing protein n=1 Tax=Kingdonia uniflora TaxID=39325 RepID=A0A7J7NVX4_9MAGN|nr:hypothetical protein GIB67_036977 [Kingdonia uniflora]